MDVAIVDYGVGNIRSICNALERIGGVGVLVRSPCEIMRFERVILPGVGAFGDAMEALRHKGFDVALRDYAHSTEETQRAMLGICLGMQLLFDVGYEFGTHQGLGILKGEVVLLDAYKLPHVGWSHVEFRECALNCGLGKREFLYFVHSYHVKPKDEHVIAATSFYEQHFVSAVAQGRIFGIQAHPEKSHDVGLKILQNFIHH